MSSKKKDPESSEESEVKDLESKLHVKKLELLEKDEEVDLLKAEVKRLNQESKRQEQLIRDVRGDADDILKDMERQMADAGHQVAQLSAQVNGLLVEVEQNKATIEGLTAERESTNEVLALTNSTMEDKAALQAQCEDLIRTIEKERKEKRLADQKILQLEKNIMSDHIKMEDLRLELNRSSTTVPVSQTQWMIKRSKKRLIAASLDEERDMPKERERNGLLALPNSSSFIYFGGTVNGVCTNETYVLQMQQGKWEQLAVKGAPPPVRGGHCMAVYERTGLKKRQQLLVVFGGRRNPLLGDVWKLDIGRKTWEEVAAGGEAPPPVEKACCCTLGNRMLVVGGDATLGNRATLEPADVPRDIYILNLDTDQWERHTPGGKVAPPLRCNATVSPSEDRLRVFLFGGSDEFGTPTNDLHVLRMDTFEWAEVGRPMIMGEWPSPREGHAAVMVGRFLIVAGGWDDKGRLGDTHVLDTDRMCWSLLDSSEPPMVQATNPRGRAKFQGISSDGRKLIGLGCGEYGVTLDECDVMDVVIPEEAFAPVAFEDVVIAQAKQAEGDPRCIDIWWSPPSESAAKVRAYKVLMSLNGSPSVETIYAGMQCQFRLHGAKPSTGYDFRVKGEYADGSAVWSDVTAVQTAPSTYTTHYPGASPLRSSSRTSHLGSARSGGSGGGAPVYIHHSPGAPGGGSAARGESVVRGAHCAGRQFTTPSPVMWRG